MPRSDYCQQLTLSACLSQKKLQIASSFLFLNGIKPFFCRQFCMTPSTKRFLRFLICCHGNKIWAIFAPNWNCFFFSIFGPLNLPLPLYKTLFFNFWFRPPYAQNLLPKIRTKSPISLLVWQIDRRCLGLPGALWGWPIQWNRAKCCGADPCFMATKFGLGAPKFCLIQSPTGLFW